MTPHGDAPGESIGQIASRLVDEGKAYARAEVDLVKAIATARIRYARLAIVLGVGAIFVAQAGLTVLVVAIGWLIATWLTPWAGLLIAAVLALAIAGLMVAYAVSHVSPAAAAPKPGTSR